VDFKINGSYEAYLYLVLLQVSCFYLHKLDLNRRASSEKNKSSDSSPNFYYLATGWIATAINWVSWLLAIYVAQQFGIASAVIFFILGFGSTVIATALSPRFPRFDLVAHIVSLPATIYLLRAMLLALGIQPGLSL
jgi:hypothetical protein